MKFASYVFLIFFSILGLVLPNVYAAPISVSGISTETVDGVTYYYPNNVESSTIFPDGAEITTDDEETQTITLPDGTVIEKIQGDTKLKINTGSTIMVIPVTTKIITTYPDGTIIVITVQVLNNGFGPLEWIIDDSRESVHPQTQESPTIIPEEYSVVLSGSNPNLLIEEKLELVRGTPIVITVIDPIGKNSTKAVSINGEDFLHNLYFDQNTPGKYKVIVEYGENILQLIDVDVKSEHVPSWIKNNAGWWAEDKIDDSSFFEGIQFLIKQGIIHVSTASPPEKQTSQEIPDWIKTSAKWWADGLTTEEEFIRSLEYLIGLGILYSPTLTDINLQNQENKETSDDDSILDSFSSPIGDLFVEVKSLDQANLYDIVTYEVTWGNKGLSDIRGNKLLISMDSEIPILSVHASTDCKLIKNGKNYIECSIDTMNPGYKQNFVFTVFVNEEAFIDGINGNVRAITSSADKNLQNNSLTIVKPLITSSNGSNPPDSLPKVADLSLSADFARDNLPHLYGKIGLIMAVTNNGPDDAEFVELVIQNPFSGQADTLEVLSDTFSCSDLTLVITCTSSQISPSSRVLVVLISNDLDDFSLNLGYEVTASVTSKTFDPISQNNYPQYKD